MGHGCGIGCPEGRGEAALPPAARRRRRPPARPPCAPAGAPPRTPSNLTLATPLHFVLHLPAGHLPRPSASMPGSPAGAAILRAPGDALDRIAALLPLDDRCADGRLLLGRLGR